MIGAQQMTQIQLLSKSILDESSDDLKLVSNQKLMDELKIFLNSTTEIANIDSTALLKEVLSPDGRVQFITWAIAFQDNWEYYGFLKSFNESKSRFEIFELTPTDVLSTKKKKEEYNQNNWPAGVYYKLVENEHNKRKVYTLFGWISNTEETAHKFLEVMTLSRNGEPIFGKAGYINYQGEQSGRLIFSYHFTSRFLLDYGQYEYSEKKWNSKKKKYDIEILRGDLIVFDDLIPMYPDLEGFSNIMVPSGHKVNAFAFEKGKWKYKEDVDARNPKRKEKKRNAPELELLKPNE